MTKNRYKTVSKIVILLIIATVAVAAVSYGKKQKNIRRRRPIPVVDLFKVPKAGNIPINLEYPARVKSVKNVKIRARTAGILIKKFYTEGKFIKKGELMYKIEPAIYRSAVNMARAQLQVSKAELDKAARDWHRVKILYGINSASARQRDAALSAYEIAVAKVKSSEAALVAAAIKLGYTDVSATISGITGQTLTDVGSLVTDGTPLTTITQINPVYVEFSIPDTDFIKNIQHHFTSDIKATVKINSKILKIQGTVNFIDTRVNIKTSSIKARAVFFNHDGWLLPGEFVRIILHGLVRKNVVTIPQRAVLQNPMGAMVFIEIHGKAEVRAVKLGETSGNSYIIRHGLKEGDLVIVDNFFKIRPGAPVKIGKIIKEQ